MRCVPCLLVLFVAATSVHADDGSPSSAPTDETRARIADLVEQLGTPSFEMREEAARELVSLGTVTMPALVEASNADDLEIRYRARRVLMQVEEQEHENRLRAFLEAKGDQPDDVLPGWGRYRRDVGDDKAAKDFFVKMQRAERRLFTAVEKREPDLDQTFAKRCVEIQYRYSYGGTRRIESERTGALLFLAGDTELEIDQTTQNRVASFCNYNDFAGMLRSGPRTGLARNLVGCWIARPDDADVNVMYQRTRLAMQYGIEQGIVPAKKLLEANGNDYRAQYALLTLGKFGGETELALVEERFDNKAVLQRSRVQNKETYTCEVRDVALAVALHMTKQNTKPYGFAKLQKQSTYLYSLNSAGFNDQKTRDAAFAKYAAWKASGAKPGDADEGESDEGESNEDVPKP